MRAIQNLKYLFYLLNYQLIYFGPKSEQIKHTDVLIIISLPEKKNLYF